MTPRAYAPELPALELGLLGRRRAALRFPLDRLGSPSAHFFFLARGGVAHGVRHLLGGAAGTVLMPAYHHGVEVEAARAAGARVEFYPVRGDLELDLEAVERLLARTRAPAVVYVTHFAGFPQPIAEVTDLARRHGARVLEDCALALGSCDRAGRPLGSSGDAAVFCLYKTLPLPHGGLLLAPGAPPPRALARPPASSTLHHLAGQALSRLELVWGRPGHLARAAVRAAVHATVNRAIEQVPTGSMHLRPVELTLGPSRLTEWMLGGVDLDAVVVRRRRNFNRLAAALDGVAPLVGAPLRPGVCPLFLPVRVRDKRAAVAALRARGVEAVDFWNVGDPACDAARFPEAATLRRELLELPIHQSLDDEAIDAVGRVARAVLVGL